MSVQSKPASAVHLTGAFPARVLTYLARSAEVHHTSSLIAGNVVALQKATDSTSRRRKIGWRFWLAHLVSDAGHINLPATGADAIDLLTDCSGVCGAKQHATDGLTASRATNSANFGHSGIPQK